MHIDSEKLDINSRERTDAVVVAKFKNTDDLSEFVKTIQKKGYVERTETMVVLKIEKEDFSLM